MTELPDLESLTRQLMAVLGPLAEAATSYASSTEREPSSCEQVWCPLCAALAVASGERHPLITVLTEHASSLLTLLHAMAAPDGSSTTGATSKGPRTEPSPGRYQPITVTIQD